MQINIEINKEQLLVHVTVAGRIEPNFFREALLQAVSSNGFEPIYKLLIDLTNIESIPIVDDARDVYELFRVMKNAFLGKIAILVPNEVVRTIAMVVSMLAKKEGLALEVFLDSDKAMEWLEVK